MIYNPYADIRDENIFKGDFHVHSNRSDGEFSPEDMFDRLLECGFNFCCLADHDFPIDGYMTHKQLQVFQGQEFSGEDGHIVGLNTSVIRDESWDIGTQLKQISSSGGYSILSHPKIREFTVSQRPAYSPKRLIVDFPGLYDGMEIYTHNVGSGFKLAIDRLDAVWNAKCGDESFRPVWGFSGSDGHHVDHISQNVGIILWAQELCQDSIMAAVKAGRFYSLANTKARFQSISLEDDCLQVVASDAVMIKVACGGNKIDAVSCRSFGGSLALDYKINGEEKFIRFEAMDSAGHCAYSNPLYRV